MNFRKAFIAALQGLPLIRFALMLGGGIMANAGAAWVFFTVARDHHWMRTEAVDIARLNSATALGLGCLTVVVVVMVALAFGKVSSVHVTTPAGSVNIEIEPADADDEGERHDFEPKADRPAPARPRHV